MRNLREFQIKSRKNLENNLEKIRKKFENIGGIFGKFRINAVPTPNFHFSTPIARIIKYLGKKCPL